MESQTHLSRTDHTLEPPLLQCIQQSSTEPKERSIREQTPTTETTGYIICMQSQKIPTTEGEKETQTEIYQNRSTSSITSHTNSRSENKTIQIVII